MTDHDTGPAPRALGVRIFASEIRVLVDEVSAHPKTETGGDLLGLWSHGDTPTIYLATRPGPGAIRERMHFQQDPAAHRGVERAAWERFGLQCVGMWHSHHELGLPILSRGDLARTMRYARRYRRDRFVDLLAFFDPDLVIRPFLYRDAAIGRTEHTRLVVLPGESPVRAALRSHPVNAVRAALRDAPVGPPRPWRAVQGAPIWPARAPSEGDEAPDELEPLPPAAGPGRGPWRAVDAVERLVDELVPEHLLASMELEVLQDALALRLSHRGRTLVVALAFDGDLRLHWWEIRGERPMAGTGGEDVRGLLTTAIRALTEG